MGIFVFIIRCHLFVIFIIIFSFFKVATVFSTDEVLNPISPTFERWDHIIDKSPDFKTFLSNPKLKDSFFQELQNYYGPDKMKTENYHLILKQLEALSVKVPGFADALWKKRPVRPAYMINYELSNGANYEVNNVEWPKRLTSIEKNLMTDAHGLIEIKDEQLRKEEIQKRVKNIEESNQQFQQKLNSTDEKARIAKKYSNPIEAEKYVKTLRERYTQKLMATKDMKELASYAVYQRLHSQEEFRDALRSGNGTNVLEALTELQNQFTKVFDGPLFREIKSIPKPLKNLVRDMMPNAQLLANDRSLFTLSAAKGFEQMVFYDSYRPIYSVFRGIFNGECVGGSCQYLDKTTPERHSVPVLKGTEIRFAEVKNTHINQTSPFRGYTEMTPFVKQGEDKKYSSLIMGVPDFKKRVYVSSSNTKKVETNIYDLWLKEASKLEKILITTGDSSVDNAKILESVRNSLSFQLGDSLGNRDEFMHLPENKDLVQGIVKNTPENSFDYGKRGQMITDATLPIDKTIVRLSPIKEEEFVSTLEKANNETKIDFFERTMNMGPNNKQKYYKKIQFLLNDPDVRVKRAVAFWISSGKIRDDKVDQIFNEMLSAKDLLPKEAVELMKYAQKDVVFPDHFAGLILDYYTQKKIIEVENQNREVTEAFIQGDWFNQRVLSTLEGSKLNFLLNGLYKTDIYQPQINQVLTALAESATLNPESRLIAMASIARGNHQKFSSESLALMIKLTNENALTPESRKRLYSLLPFFQENKDISIFKFALERTSLEKDPSSAIPLLNYLDQKLDSRISSNWIYQEFGGGSTRNCNLGS
jgi:hypothetical protein